MHDGQQSTKRRSLQLTSMCHCSMTTSVVLPSGIFLTLKAMIRLKLLVDHAIIFLVLSHLHVDTLTSPNAEAQDPEDSIIKVLSTFGVARKKAMVLLLKCTTEAQQKSTECTVNSVSHVYFVTPLHYETSVNDVLNKVENKASLHSPCKLFYSKRLCEWFTCKQSSSLDKLCRGCWNNIRASIKCRFFSWAHGLNSWFKFHATQVLPFMAKHCIPHANC
eukprot:m.253655 g.253655  ORF g.253655 m.253655 type:complete len:219 (-) comp16161_c1_seq1:1341-1997(-)